jgi:hypothetical protein
LIIPAISGTAVVTGACSSKRDTAAFFSVTQRFGGEQRTAFGDALDVARPLFDQCSTQFDSGMLREQPPFLKQHRLLAAVRDLILVEIMTLLHAEILHKIIESPAAGFLLVAF